MISKQLLKLAATAGIAILTMAVKANAATITYNTNATGTEFVSPTTGLSLNSSSGLAATLTFQPDSDIAIGVPSNINLGLFALTCTACLTNETSSAIFNAFTFDLVITDQTDGGATGEFVGTSPGGSVAFNSSTVTIDWSPLQLGPGASDTLSGNFGTTFFNITPTSRIVAPNSGANVGETTVQGALDSSAIGISSVPEPGTLGLIGTGLLGLVLLGRGRMFSK
jgi:hypothetical protein